MYRPRRILSIKTVLNVGGGTKAIPLPTFYADFEHVLLDLNPAGSPDVLCDARNLDTLPMGRYDAVYCSHNLEHYYRHDVAKVLAGFLHVLRADGFVHIMVPDLEEVMRTAVAHGLDVEDVLYRSPAGPVTVLDTLFGYGPEIERSGQDFYAHKTGFTSKSLTAALVRAGFASVYNHTSHLQIEALAFRQVPDAATRAQFRLPAEDRLP